MELKSKVENFKKQENKLKIELLKEIRKEFDKYEKDVVLFYPNCDYEENEDLCDECRDLTCSFCSPYIMDDNCQIDGTYSPYYIKKENNKFILYCINSFSDTDYLILEKPSWELSVSDLSGLVEILKDPLIKQINGEKIQTMESDEEYREINKEELEREIEKEKQKLQKRIDNIK